MVKRFFCVLGFYLILGINGCTPISQDTPGNVSTSSSTVLPDHNVNINERNEETTIPNQTPTSKPIEDVTAMPQEEMATTSPDMGTTTVVLDHISKLYIQSYGQGYSQFDYDLSRGFNFEIGQEYPLQILHYAGNGDIENSALGPGNSVLLSFANFANKVAYWTANGVGQLWLSDLMWDKPEVVYTDVDGVYTTDNYRNGVFNLIWLPDDLHLIFYTTDETPNFIVDTQSNTVESWPWNCNRIALSPKSQHLATWCTSEEGSSRFAILEWGGEIWYSDMPPVELVQTEIVNLTFWAWPSNGDKLVYLDPSDSDGSLFLVNSQGNPQKLFDNTAWWQNEDVSESQIDIPIRPLQWSQNGDYLLIFANELIEGACPDYVYPFGTLPNPIYHIPCWQVIDMRSKTVIWSWATVVNTFSESESETWQTGEASISPDGKLVAVYVKPIGTVQLIIANLESGEQELWSSIEGSIMRWDSLIPER